MLLQSMFSWAVILILVSACSSMISFQDETAAPQPSISISFLQHVSRSRYDFVSSIGIDKVLLPRSCLSFFLELL